MSSYRVKLSQSTDALPVFLENGSEVLDVFNSGFNDNPADKRRVADYSKTSIPLIRRGARDFADELAQSLVNIMENFSAVTAPLKPLKGQLWYDISPAANGGKLKVNIGDANNIVWQIIHTSEAGYSTTAQTVSLSATPASGNTPAAGVTGSATFAGATLNLTTTPAVVPGLAPATYTFSKVTVDRYGRITGIENGVLPQQEGILWAIDVPASNVVNVVRNLNVQGKLKENGNDLLPRGVVTMWTGAASAIPAGWLLCNGSNGTPNLRDRFVVGAGGNYNPGDAGGTDSITASGTTSQAGAHAHGVAVAAAGEHAHDGGSTALTIDQMPTHQHATNWGESNGRPYPQYGALGGQNGPRNGIGSRDTDFDNWNYLSEPVGGGLGHSHTVGSGGTHTHAASTDSGGQHTHTMNITGDNRPLYYAICFIMKA